MSEDTEEGIGLFQQLATDPHRHTRTKNWIRALLKHETFYLGFWMGEIYQEADLISHGLLKTMFTSKAA